MSDNEQKPATSEKPKKKRRGCLYWGLRIAALLLLLLVIAGVAGFIYNQIEINNANRRFVAPGTVVQVNGRQMHILCLGEGEPTVVLESGGGSSSLDWRLVQQEVAGFTRVCSYDRAGYAWSEGLGGTTRSYDQLMGDLHALLNATNIDGPIVLVGHSFGGLLVQRYANQYSEDVAGMVLVDSASVDLYSRMPQSIQTNQVAANQVFNGLSAAATLGIFRLLGDQAAGLLPNQFNQFPLEAQAAIREFSLYRGSYFQIARQEAQLSANAAESIQPITSLPNVPLLVITHGIGGDWIPPGPVSAEEVGAAEQTWQTVQRELASLTPDGEVIVAENSGHLIILDEPEVVVDAIRRVVDEANE
ncbi:MAG: alpha/beta hydrolase [Chloroflexi bacterium]|nr:alpha/beta hydrolase [Chloroflexota bacterium]